MAQETIFDKIARLREEKVQLEKLADNVGYKEIMDILKNRLFFHRRQHIESAIDSLDSSFEGSRRQAEIAALQLSIGMRQFLIEEKENEIKALEAEEENERLMNSPG